MNNLQILKLFVRFLKENNCYKQFINNYSRTSRYLLSDLFEYAVKDDYYNIIESAFSWKNTKDGYEYWRAINFKWRLIISAIIYDE